MDFEQIWKEFCQRRYHFLYDEVYQSDVLGEASREIKRNKVR